MIHFPHNPLKRLAAASVFGPVRQPFLRDVLWGKPVFKAPGLTNPPIPTDPLPFTVARITHPAR